ncbi:hypothetical protein D3C85_834410 [compost metagenome]
MARSTNSGWLAGVVDDANLVGGGGAADAHLGVGQAGQCNDRVRDGLRHAPPADGLDAEGLRQCRIADAGAPQAESVLLRSRLGEQGTHEERQGRVPGTAVTHRHVPEAAGREARLQDQGAAAPE